MYVDILGLSGLETDLHAHERSVAYIRASATYYPMLTGRSSAIAVQTSGYAKKKKTGSLDWVPITSAGNEDARKGDFALREEMNNGQGASQQYEWRSEERRVGKEC